MKERPTSQPPPPRRELRLKLLDSYVSREFLFSYVVSVVVILSLRTLLDLFAMFDEFIDARSPQEAVGVLTVLGRIVDYYVPQLFAYFRDFSGVMVLVAAVFSLMRMTRQNELTAVLAGGVSLKRLIAPIVLLGFGLNLLMVIDQEIFLPRLADRIVRKHGETDMRQRVPIAVTPDRDENLLSAREFDPDAGKLYDMVVIKRRDGRMTGFLTAAEALWKDAGQRWALTEGRYQEIREAGANDGARPGLTTPQFYESNLSAELLWLQRHSGFKSLMSSADLGEYLRRAELKPAERAEALAERHFRFTDPIINMVLLLLGLPLLVSRERRSTKTAIALCLLGSGGLYLATFACKLLVGSGVPLVGNPLLAAWLPIIIFLPVSVLALDEIKT